MKKILILIISVLTVLTLSGCTNKNLGEKSTYNITNDKVTMTVKENTLTSTSATIILTNKTEEGYIYGEPYHLEIKDKDTWYILEPKEELYFIMPAYSLKANEKVEKEYNWEHGYGELDKGTYRLVTDFSTDKEEIYVAAEFTIE